MAIEEIGIGKFLITKVLTSALNADELTESVDSEIASWMKGLPSELSLEGFEATVLGNTFKDAASGTERRDSPKLEALTAAIRTGDTFPGETMFAEAIMERWAVFVEHKAKSNFFTAREEVVRTKVVELVERIHHMLSVVPSRYANLRSLSEHKATQKALQQVEDLVKRLPGTDIQGWLAEYEKDQGLLLARFAHNRFSDDEDWPLVARYIRGDEDQAPVTRVYSAWAIDSAQTEKSYEVEGTDLLAAGDFLQRVRWTDVFVNAPGGFGKTSFLTQLARAALEREWITFYFDLSNLGHEVESADMSELVTRTLVCRRKQQLSRIYQAVAVPDREKIIIVDGLNENTSNKGDSLIALFIALRSRGINTTLVFGDRMVQRPICLDLARYLDSATIHPLSSTFVEKLLGEAGQKTPLGKMVGDNFERWLPLLETPFFLDLAMKMTTPGHRKPSPASRHGLIAAYFSQQLGSDSEQDEESGDPQLRKLAEGAMKWYRAKRGVVAGSPEAIDYLGSQLLRDLKAPGIIVEAVPHAEANEEPQDEREEGDGEQTSLKFKHQLYHDFLVGTWLSGVLDNPVQELWTVAGFNDATLMKGGFDAIEFAAEALAANEATPSRSANAFLQAVYDWDYSASLRTLAMLSHAGARDVVAPQMRLALRLVTAEKRWDRFMHTVARVEIEIQELPRDAETEHYDGAEKSFRDVSDLRELQEFCLRHPLLNSALKGRPDERYWQEWRDLFAGTSLQESADADSKRRYGLRSLSRDPLFGWTAATVFRRQDRVPDEQFFDTVMRMYEFSRATPGPASQGSTARWRLVHLLGADKRPLTFEFLCNVIRDNGDKLTDPEDRYVRYGAVRSALEVLSYAEASTRDQRIGSLREALNQGVRQADSDAACAKLVGQQILDQTILNPDASPPPRWHDSLAPLRQLFEQDGQEA